MIVPTVVPLTSAGLEVHLYLYLYLYLYLDLCNCCAQKSAFALPRGLGYTRSECEPLTSPIPPAGLLCVALWGVLVSQPLADLRGCLHGGVKLMVRG